MQIFPLQLGIWLLCLISLGYLGAGTVLYLNDRYRNELEGISWLDRVYPPNWHLYQAARGDSYVSQGKGSLESGKFTQALHQIRTGLARSPKNLEGRTLLAEMYLAAKRPEWAQKTLTEGLAYHFNDHSFLQQTLALLFQRQEDEEIVEISQSMLKRSGLSTDSRRLLQMAAAKAYYYRGNFDQAEDALDHEGLRPLPDSRLLTALIEWDRGFPALALALIDQLSKEYPSNLEIYRTHIQWMIEQGNVDSARRASLLRRIRYPEQGQPRIDLLYAFDKTHDESAVADETTALLADFANDYAVLLQLGDFAANTGRVGVAQQVLAHAQSHDMPLEGPTLMFVESMIIAKNYREALEHTQLVLAEHPDWQQKIAPVFNGLQAICYVALGEREEANLFLDNYLNLSSLRAENLVAVSERLNSVGATREARRVLEHAVERDPLNQAALAQLIEFDLDSDSASDLPAHLERMLEMRRPSTSLLRRAYEKLGQDRFHFTPNRNELMDQLLVSLSGYGSSTR